MQSSKTTSEAAILSVKNLNKNYGNGALTVLCNICFTVNRGEFIVIHGESGSGKSTLLQLLAGFDKAQSGEIWVENTNLCRLTESQRARFRRDHIGFVFQQFHLLPELTALENVMMPLLIKKEKVKKAREQAEKYLCYVGLKDRMNHTPERLSGGQNQRVAIARALICNSKIIFADEPTGNLDSKNRSEVLELLQKVNRDRNTTIMMVTHSAEERRIASRVIELRDGVII